jgi:hypothetical protein
MPLLCTPRAKKLLEELCQELDKEAELELSKLLAQPRKAAPRKSRRAPAKKSRPKKSP